MIGVPRVFLSFEWEWWTVRIFAARQFLPRSWAPLKSHCEVRPFQYLLCDSIGLCIFREDACTPDMFTASVCAEKALEISFVQLYEDNHIWSILVDYSTYISINSYLSGIYLVLVCGSTWSFPMNLMGWNLARQWALNWWTMMSQCHGLSGDIFTDETSDETGWNRSWEHWG